MKLATIETITKLTPIPDSDNIEEALVQGWGVVVRKGEYTVGDKCIYVPIDTLVDSNKNHFAHLKLKSGSNWVKIQSRKMRGVWSQGLTIPLSNLDSSIIGIINKSVSCDLDDLIGVEKYQKEVILTQINGLPAQKADPFPTNIISKTDEANLRSNPSCLDELRGHECYITKKMDGQSLTMIVDMHGNFIVCSRNLVLDIGSVMYQFIINENLEARMRSLGFPVAIQCEFAGPGVNKNQVRLKKNDIFVFNIKRLTNKKHKDMIAEQQAVESGSDATDSADTTAVIDGEGDATIDSDRCYGDYCGLLEMLSLCSQLGVQMVPLLDVIHLPVESASTEQPTEPTAPRECTTDEQQQQQQQQQQQWTIQRFQEYANSVHYEDRLSGKKFPGEGIVIRPTQPVWSYKLHKSLSVKVINQNYKD